MMKEKLAEMQKEVNELYKRDGLTDEVLNKQIEINQLRHKHNIVDETELLYEDFVQ